MKIKHVAETALAALTFAWVSMGADSCSTDTSTTASSGQATETVPRGPFRANNAQVTRLFNEQLGAESGGKPRVIDAQCNRRTCFVNYRAKAIAINGERELFEDQRAVWRTLFSDPKLKSARLIPHTTVTSVGGKESNQAVLLLTCDRAAARQIDWSYVDVDGVKTLCDWIPRVDLG